MAKSRIKKLRNRIEKLENQSSRTNREINRYKALSKIKELYISTLEEAVLRKSEAINELVALNVDKQLYHQMEIARLKNRGLFNRILNR